jgi:hypothetical protein
MDMGLIIFLVEFGSIAAFIDNPNLTFVKEKIPRMRKEGWDSTGRQDFCSPSCGTDCTSCH